MRAEGPTAVVESPREVAPGITVLPSKRARGPRTAVSKKGDNDPELPNPGPMDSNTAEASLQGVQGKAESVRKIKGAQTTPARTLFDILHETGWAEKKSDFSRILDVRQKNAYMYLDDGEGRIKASAETIFAWIRCVQRHTNLSIEVTLLGDGRIRFFYRGTTGAAVPGMAKDERVPPTERFAREPAWMDDARERRASARRQAHAPKKRKTR